MGSPAYKKAVEEAAEKYSESLERQYALLAEIGAFNAEQKRISDEISRVLADEDMYEAKAFFEKQIDYMIRCNRNPARLQEMQVELLWDVNQAKLSHLNHLERMRDDLKIEQTIELFDLIQKKIEEEKQIKLKDFLDAAGSKFAASSHPQRQEFALPERRAAIRSLCIWYGLTNDMVEINSAVIPKVTQPVPQTQSVLNAISCKSVDKSGEQNEHVGFDTMPRELRDVTEPAEKMKSNHARGMSQKPTQSKLQTPSVCVSGDEFHETDAKKKLSFFESAEDAESKKRRAELNKQSLAARSSWAPTLPILKRTITTSKPLPVADFVTVGKPHLQTHSLNILYQ